jgi:hypothetical protein
MVLHRPVEVARLIGTHEASLQAALSASVQSNGDGQLVTNMELGAARWNF